MSTTKIRSVMYADMGAGHCAVVTDRDGVVRVPLGGSPDYETARKWHDKQVLNLEATAFIHTGKQSVTLDTALGGPAQQGDAASDLLGGVPVDFSGYYENFATWTIR